MSLQVGQRFSGGFTHLSPPFPGSPVQGDAGQSREAGPSMERSLRVRSPRHASAPNLSQVSQGHSQMCLKVYFAGGAS